MPSRRDLVIVASAILATFVAVAWAQSPAKPAMESTVFDWSKLKVDSAKYGSVRHIFDSRTASLEHFECHATTLNPGETTHPPRRQTDEELVVVKEGVIEANQNDQPKRTGRRRNLRRGQRYVWRPQPWRCPRHLLRHQMGRRQSSINKVS